MEKKIKIILIIGLIGIVICFLLNILTTANDFNPTSPAVIDISGIGNMTHEQAYPLCLNYTSQSEAFRLIENDSSGYIRWQRNSGFLGWNVFTNNHRNDMVVFDKYGGTFCLKYKNVT